MPKSKKRNIKTIAVILTSLGVGLMIGVIVWLFIPKEARISNSADNYKLSSLLCNATNPENAFFYSDKAMSSSYVVKVAYDDGKMDNVSFSYTATFESDAIAENVSSGMQAKYNIFLNEKNIVPRTYSPNIRNVANVVKIDLSASSDNITPWFSKIIFSKNINSEPLMNSDQAKLKQLYASVGYTCNYSE